VKNNEPWARTRHIIYAMSTRHIEIM